MHTGSPKEPRSAKNGPGLESDDWMDISVPISEGMVTWPGDPPVRILRLSDIDNGDDCTLSALSMSVHTATHMDAPSHFTNLRHGIDEMPLSAVVGNARVNDTASLHVSFPGVPFQDSLDGPSNYIVTYLADDYSWALVGDPSRVSGFVLSRSPVVDAAAWQQIRTVVEDAGYNSCLMLTSPTTEGLQEIKPLCTV